MHHKKTYDKVRYLPETDGFYAALQDRVARYFDVNAVSRYANTRFFAKAVFLILLYLGLYFYSLMSGQPLLSFLAYIFMGPVAIIIGLNVAHDAAHGMISKRSWVNQIFLYAFDFLGASSMIWKKRHVDSHHKYSNIMDEDADLKQTSLVRIFPEDEIHKVNRFQHWYMPLVFLHYTIFWLVIRDFQDLMNKGKGSSLKMKFTVREVTTMIFFKLFYFTYILVLPLLFSSLLWWQVAVAYLLMNWLAGITITLALVPAHVASTSAFPLPDKNGFMPHSWSHHQLLTTTDYATSDGLVNWLMGGFNHHVAHHLIPKVSHVHYKVITPLVRETAEEFNLPYNYEESLANAYMSHFRLLKANGWEHWQELEMEVL